ncbi:MAG: YciI family protein [Bacteroidota bacterium]
MKEFMFLFRLPTYDYSKATPAEMQGLAKKWKDWGDGIKAQGKFVREGIRLSMEGKVLKASGVTDGPFAETKEVLGSFIIVKAENIDEATTLAHGCPALEAGGSVEIRQIIG